jgi:hypothetical protein
VGGGGLTWVVKVLHEPVLEDGERFLAEVALLPPARAAGRQRHPNPSSGYSGRVQSAGRSRTLGLRFGVGSGKTL